MSDGREGFRFLPTQQFLMGRWNTPLKEIVTGIQANVEIRAILDPCLLDRPENVDSHAYPHYPREAMSVYSCAHNSRNAHFPSMHHLLS